MSQQLFGAAAWIGERLAVGSLQGVLVIGLAWAACRWIPRVPPALQAWVWWLVAAKLVFALLPIPAIPVPLLPAQATSPGISRVADLDAGSVMAAQPEDTPGLNWLGLFAGAWLGGVLLHGLMLLRAALTTRNLVRRATPLSDSDRAAVLRTAAAIGLTRLPRVCASPEVDVAQVVGLRDPTVLLPADARGRLTAAEWQMALSHELMHVRRRDVPLGCLPALAERLYFFHPLARLAAREYVIAREAACDAAVVRALDVAADDYGRLLVRIGVSRSRSVLVASSAAASTSCLRRRLEMLQHTSSTTVSRVMTAGVTAVALLALAPVEIVAQRPQAPPAPQALPALPAPPAPPAAPAASIRPLPPAPPQTPAAPAAPALPPAPPPALVAPAVPVAPAPPLPPPPPSGDEVVLRLKSPATEQEAVDTALRVLETQLAQIDQQAAADVRLTVDDRTGLAQARRKLEELMQVVQSQARAGDNAQQGSMLARQMAELNQKRDALVRQQQELQRQLAQTNQAIERMKMDLRTAEEAAKKR
jgi:beta-lactamase regulating signal transducer with metallopeptidase domain